MTSRYGAQEEGGGDDYIVDVQRFFMGNQVSCEYQVGIACEVSLALGGSTNQQSTFMPTNTPFWSIRL